MGLLARLLGLLLGLLPFIRETASVAVKVSAGSPEDVRIAGMSTALSAAAPAAAPAAAEPGVASTTPFDGAKYVESLKAHVSEEEAAAIKDQVDDAVKEATREGFDELEEAEEEGKQKWVTEANLIAAEGKDQVEEAKEADLKKVESKVEAVSDSQLKIVDQMSSDIKAEEARVEAKVEESSAEFARSEAQNAEYESVESMMQGLYDEQAKVEATRKEALLHSQDVLAAAGELTDLAKEASTLSQNLAGATPEEQATSVQSQMDVSVSQARHASQLSTLSIAATKEAEEKATATEKTARLAEEEAQGLYNQVMETARKISLLTYRAKAAVSQVSMARVLRQGMP